MGDLTSPRGARRGGVTAVETIPPSSTTVLSPPSVVVPLVRRKPEAVEKPPAFVAPETPTPTPPPKRPTTKPAPPKRSTLEEVIEEDAAAISDELRRREEDQEKLLPPPSVLPRVYLTLPNVKTIRYPPDIVKGDGIGILRRLSMYNSYLVQLYNVMHNKSRVTIEWDFLISIMFGTHGRDDFMGFGTRGTLPAHDQLGRFPIIVDSQNREYFEGFNGESSSTTINSSTDRIILAMRIPRHITTKNNAKSADLSIHPLDFPFPGDIINVTFCGIPFFPFYFSELTQRTNSIVEDQTKKLLNDVYLRLKAIAPAIYQTQARLKVISTDQHRGATCIVELEVSHHDSFKRIFTATQIFREQWNMNIFDFIVAYEKFGHSSRAMVDLFVYLQTDWIPHISDWTKKRKI